MPDRDSILPLKLGYSQDLACLRLSLLLLGNTPNPTSTLHHNLCILLLSRLDRKTCLPLPSHLDRLSTGGIVSHQCQIVGRHHQRSRSSHHNTVWLSRIRHPSLILRTERMATHTNRQLLIRTLRATCRQVRFLYQTIQLRRGTPYLLTHLGHTMHGAQQCDMRKPNFLAERDLIRV